MTRFLPLAVFVLVLLVVAVPLLRDGGAPQPPAALVGRSAPPLPFEKWDDDIKEGLTLVNFFASWCAPCAEEQSLLKTLAAAYPVRVYGVAYKDTPAKTVAFLERHGNPFVAVVQDATGRLSIDWGVYGVPETYLLRDGIVVFRHVGVLTPQLIENTLQPYLAGNEMR